jgi:hypothetical protein
MSGAFEIKIVNPKEVKAAAAKSGPTDMQDAPSADASGLLVQPMKSSPR